MKMTVKRSYLLDLQNVLVNADKVFAKPISGRFRYMASLNAKVCGDERDAVMQAFPYDETWIEFERKRVSIIREGGIETNDDLLKLSEEERVALEERVGKLADEYKDAIEAEKELDKARDEFLAEEIEVDLRTTTPDELPEIIAGDDWNVWNILFNNGNGIVRE